MNAVRHARNGTAALALAGIVAGGTQLVLGTSAQGDWGMLSANTRVNVRSGPSTSTARLGMLSNGQQVRQTGPTRNGWTPVLWQGRAVWVYSSYLASSRPSQSSPAPVSSTSASTMTTTEAVNVRTGPSTSYARVTMLQGGTTVQLTGARRGVWYEISFQGAKRWIHSAYLTSTPTSPSTPTRPTPTIGRAKATTRVNVRQGPGTNFARVGELQQGTVVDITGTNRSGFTQVSLRSQSVWVASQYLVKVSSSTTVPVPTLPKQTGVRYALTDTNVRSSDAANASVVAVVPAGTKFGITGKVSNGRAEVIHQGAVRWVALTCLGVNPPAAKAFTPVTGTLNTNGSVGLDAMRPSTKRVAIVVRQQFPAIKTQYGVRRDPYPDHPSGRAVDNMLPNYRANQALGWSIAHYLQDHAEELNIQYIIFGQKIWSVARSDEGWRPMSNRGSDTANHYDHIHVTVNY